MLGTLNSTLDAHDPNGDCQLMRTDRCAHRGTIGSVFRLDGRQPFRYAPEPPTTSKVRVARYSLATKWHTLENHPKKTRRDRSPLVVDEKLLDPPVGKVIFGNLQSPMLIDKGQRIVFAATTQLSGIESYSL